MLDRDELIRTFFQVAKLSGVRVGPSDVRVEFAPAPHRRPSKLPADSHGVYVFWLGDTCLKVGKAGPKTAARFCSQHYGLHAPSTLAKSILGHRDQVAGLVRPDRKDQTLALSEQDVGQWIEQNTSRMNVLIPSATGPFALSLLEAYLHCRLQPRFEGHTA